MNRATSRDVAILRPYAGSHHILPDGCPKVMSTFPGEQSSRVSYSFNSLGYRGEEFDLTADRHVFVCGGSITLGLGLDYSDAWVSVFRREYARLQDSPESSINLQNFSSSGCSNSYIARTMIGQCGRFPPTLALVEMTFSHRSEILLNGRSYNIGPWCVSDGFDDGAKADGHHDDLRQMIREKSKAYYELDSDLLAGQDLLKNALLLQLFFRTHDIPFLIGMAESLTSELPDDPLLAPWLEALDPERVFTIPERHYHVDQSAAPGHPGPEGSRAIAESFLSRYMDLYGQDRRIPVHQNHTVQASWKKWLGEKLKTPKKEDANVYPLY